MLGSQKFQGGEDIVKVGADPENEEDREGGPDQNAPDVAADGADGEEKRSEHGAIGVGDHAEGEAQKVDFAAHGLQADRHGDEGETPKDDAEARLADEFLLVGILNALAGVDEGERGLRQGGEGGVEAGNGGGEGSGEDEAGETGWKDGGDPDGEHGVGILRELRGFGGAGRVLEVVNKKGRANEEHEDGNQKRDATRNDRLRGVGGGAAAEHALGIELIGAESGEVLERHGEEADPKRELHIGIGAEVEEAEFPGLAGGAEDFGEASVDLKNHDPQRRQAPADENEKLDHIGPNDSGHPTHQGPGDGKDTDDGDAPLEGQTGDGPENEGGDEEADALAEDGAEKKEPGGERACARAEALLHVIVGAENPALVENFDEPNAHDEARHDRADAPLEVGEIPSGGEDHSGHSDKSDGADLGGHDRAGNGGPGERAAGEEEILHRGLRAAQAVADPGGEGEVGEENDPVDR